MNSTDPASAGASPLPYASLDDLARWAEALGGDEPEKIIERLTKFGASAAFVEVTAEA